MATAQIVYASMTGNTEEIANIVGDELTNLGVETEVIDCSSTDAASFADYDICIVATYTYGMGDLPDEIVDFYEELEEVDLSGKVFGVCGSGDTSYGEHYCQSIDDFETQFMKTGATLGAESVKIEFNAEDEDIDNLKAFAKSLVESV